MPIKQPQLAKLTRPRLHKAVARERLFALLDEGREHKPAICVVGPPGAGKTTLVASWLDARKIKGIWFQVDPGDADLASFFYYLGEAARPFTRKRQGPLPRLTPEYLPDIGGFSRRFFRELFSRLPEGATLVLDNYQESPQEDHFQSLITNAIDELPGQCAVVLVSRKTLPPLYSRHIANEQISLLGWEQLRLDPRETRAIAASKLNLDADTLQHLLASTGGWAAGIVLALEQYKQTASRLQAKSATQEAIFDYFATQIFDSVSPGLKRFLMQTAHLPRMSIAVCEALSDVEGAANMLEDLYRRHLFTDRRPGQTPTYSYHDLFRNFLLKCAADAFSDEELQDLLSRSARLLETSGDTESAVRLFAEAKQWREVQRLIVRQAPLLLAQGRWQTFDEWVGLLPTPNRTDSAWLVYWSGMAKLATQPALARVQLEQAYSMFKAANNWDGSLLSASSVVQCLFLEAAEFKALDQWLPVLEELIETQNEFPTPAAELQVWAGMLVAIIFGRPGHRMSDRCADRIVELVREPIDANQRMIAAAALMLHTLYTGKFQLGRQLETLVQPILAEPELTALNAAFWYCYLGYLSVADHTLEHGHKVFDRAEEIGEREGFHYVLTTAYSGRAALLRVGSDVEPLMKLSEPDMESTRPYDVAHYLGNSLYRAADRGDWKRAVEFGEQTMSYLKNAGTLYQRLIWAVPTSWAWAELENMNEARHHLALADAILDQTGSVCYESLVTFAHANIARIEGNEDEYIQCLRDGFGAAARNPSKRGYAFWVPTAGAPRLCADALDQRIETQFVREYIHDYPISPPADAPESWPWPVRVYTLGGFEIIRNDEPVTFSHKQPRKPLALLKAVIALGEIDVPLQKLIDALWPDEDGAAAQRALEVALLRLRRILVVPDAIQVRDRTLSLNHELVWTDLRALDGLAVNIAPEENDGAGFDAQAQRIFALYRGPFLASDMDASWAISRRERARSRFVKLVSVMGFRHESKHDWVEALRWYDKGLEIDDLAESFYQGIMRCDLALGKRADGLSTFRRMRQILSVTLGAAPSQASEALFRDLQSN